MYQQLLQFKLVLHREMPQYYTQYYHKQKNNKIDVSKFTDYS